MNALRGELAKARSLPAVWVAIAVGLIVPTGIAILNSGKQSPDIGYQELAFGTFGAIVLGVVLASSEYFTEGEEHGRQVTTSLIVVPSRIRLLAAKIVALAVLTAGLATAATLLTFLSARIEMDVPRVLAIIVYWVLTSLLAFGITMLARNGIIPLTVLIVNSGLVSVSFLLTKLTPLAVYLPDVAGVQMFVGKMDVPIRLSPLTGGLVMCGWVAAVLLAGFVAFTRRDA
ncbi:ABC transporter permease [Kibdelosporangium philippinense]|uniref:ABC transporter permease n=1 Tax=Kibdelosporangium philippinense TaxID=211113 RepID=A0ABS8ZYT1_9PSEU|nr:ABC transporter permease [Kibdelosporangium philippinense]MCE7012101.1 ABC transporter permease [Kibdelosporangium philippinense]